MKRKERERLRLPKPRDVDGFSEAASRGHVPLVPSSAPTRSTVALVPSANRILRTEIAKLVAMTVFFFAVVAGAFPRLAVPAWFEIMFLLTMTGAWLAMMLRTSQIPGRRTLDETMRGYSTLGDNSPNYSAKSEHSWGEAGAPWDYSGVWVLDREFEVRSPPSLEADPPGFYPSPHRAEQWELWTGKVWSGMYQDGPWPRVS